ncbi:MAG: TolC family protein [Acidobacteriota bacterium]
MNPIVQLRRLPRLARLGLVSGLVACLLAPAAGATRIVKAPAPPPKLPDLRAATQRQEVHLTLAAVIEQVLAGNFDVQVADNEIVRRTSQITGARAAFDPTINADIQHRWAVQPEVNQTQAAADGGATSTVVNPWSVTLAQRLITGANYRFTLSGQRQETNAAFVGLSPNYSVNATLTFTQPLLEGFGRDANLRALRTAKNDALSAHGDRVIQVRESIKQTVDAYWDLVFTLEDLNVKEQALRLAMELEAKNRIMVDVGTMAPLEVLQAQSEVAERQRAIIAGRAAIRAAEDALRRLMGLPMNSPLWDRALRPSERPSFSDGRLELAEALALGMENRRELSNAARTVDNAELALAAAADTLKPQLDVVATLGTAGLAGDINDNPLTPEIEILRQNYVEAFEQIGDRDFNNWSVALNFSHPLRNRAARVEHLIARLNLEDARIGLDRQRQTVVLEVRDAVRNLDTAREQIAAARVARELQQRKLDAEISRFDNGLSTNFEVLQFQTDLTASESAELQAIIDHAKARSALGRATGTLVDDLAPNLAPAPLDPFPTRKERRQRKAEASGS